MKKITQNKYIQFVVAVMLMTTLSTQDSLATGKRRRNRNDPTSPKQAFPLRLVFFKDFGTVPFHLPGGEAVDSGLVVKDLVDTQINQSEKFRTISTSEPQGRHAIIVGGITAMVFEVAKFGIKFGYNFGGGEVCEGGETGDGEEGSSTSATDCTGGKKLEGELDVKIGSISADFKIYDSETGETYAASSVDHATAELDLSFKVNFDEISIGPEFITKTPVRNAIRKLAQKAMEKLATQSRVNFIPWSTTVLEVDTVRNLVLIDSGVREQVVPGNVFQVYSRCEAAGCFERFVTDVKVKNSMEYSETELYQSQPEVLRTIRPGDSVYIKYISP